MKTGVGNAPNGTTCFLSVTFEPEDHLFMTISSAWTKLILKREEAMALRDALEAGLREMPRMEEVLIHGEA